MRVLTTAILALCGAASLVHAQSTQAPSAVPVGVVIAERKPVAKSLDFVGRVEAVQRVEIRRASPAIWKRSRSRKAISSRMARTSTASKKGFSKLRSVRPRVHWRKTRPPRP